MKSVLIKDSRGRIWVLPLERNPICKNPDPRIGDLELRVLDHLAGPLELVHVNEDIEQILLDLQ